MPAGPPTPASPARVCPRSDASVRCSSVVRVRPGRVCVPLAELAYSGEPDRDRAEAVGVRGDAAVGWAVTDAQEEAGVERVHVVPEEGEWGRGVERNGDGGSCYQVSGIR